MTVLDLDYTFSSLSLRDLLDARDAYHFHLLHRPNVIGTAVGLYLIRKEEEWPRRRGEGRTPKNKKVYPRTLFNSEVRDYSWPCVLVFVRQWVPEQDFGAKRPYKATDAVPKTLYLADGRAVPVCVVLAPDISSDPAPVDPMAWPAYKFGGGLPIEVEVQGEEHLATIGCVVSDGHHAYALTARHVSGPAGTEVFARSRDGLHRIGASAGKELTRLPFSDVYATFAGRFSYVAFDVGLILLDDVTDWTSNTYGLPPLGPMADLSQQNLSLRLIDQPLVGVGAASGLLSANIKALFYRYRSVGGYDYIADYLISPLGENQTRHGDSGMVWHLDVTDPGKIESLPLAQHDLRPLAVEWGGQIFTDGETKASFALATSLANVCRLLDVELLTDVDRGVSGYWGRTGHYGIASIATGLVGDARLKTLMEKNLELISFDADDIAQKDFDKSIGKLAAENKFVPLADVPDEIWKQLPFGKKARIGGRDIAYRTGPEHPVHYADMDMSLAPNEPSLRQICLDDPSQITPDAWIAYYLAYADVAEAEGQSEIAADFRDPLHQGLLPFRLWQFFDAMVGFLKAGDITGFITAAGTAAHYMGDASQPLHGSIFADGDPSRTADRHHPELGTTEIVKYGKGVHSGYETNMVSFKAVDLLAMVADLAGDEHGLPLASTGSEIALATIKLMDRVAGILPVMTIIDTWEDAGAKLNQTVYNKMWAGLGEGTASVMAEGAKALAMLWESAWVAAGPGATDGLSLDRVKRKDARALYVEKSFVPSLTIDRIGPLLK